MWGGRSETLVSERRINNSGNNYIEEINSEDTYIRGEVLSEVDSKDIYIGGEVLSEVDSEDNEFVGGLSSDDEFIEEINEDMDIPKELNIGGVSMNEENFDLLDNSNDIIGNYDNIGDEDITGDNNLIVNEGNIIEDIGNVSANEGNIIGDNRNVSANENNIIAVSNVFKTYDGGRINALNGVNIEIKSGEFVSIMGPSGSGKSTLLNMCGALDKPSSGDVFINGENLNDVKDLSEIRSNQIGFIFQMHNLIPSLSVLDNVMIPLFETSIKSNERKRIALAYLDIVGLEDKANLKPNILSGGERQRVAIARALVNSPSIILADESTGALDSHTGNEIMNFLKLLHKNNDVTLIVVTHDPHIGNMANRTINVLDGKIQN